MLVEVCLCLQRQQWWFIAVPSIACAQQCPVLQCDKGPWGQASFSSYLLQQLGGLIKGLWGGGGVHAKAG